MGEAHSRHVRSFTVASTRLYIAESHECILRSQAHLSGLSNSRVRLHPELDLYLAGTRGGSLESPTLRKLTLWLHKGFGYMEEWIDVR
jgi:hypothetical protein